MTEEQFKYLAEADALMHRVVALRQNPGDADVALEALVINERYVRIRNRRLLGLFRWRYWLNRYYGWNIARLKRSCPTPPSR